VDRQQISPWFPTTSARTCCTLCGRPLSNTARHGKASGVEVSIGAGNELSLLVSDNGSRIMDTPRRSGLANLAWRAEQYGGTLTVGPADNGGTELHWRVPLPASGSPAEPGR